MKYLIDISQRQAQKIQVYLDKGDYLNISQFVITAIENQFSLEDNQTPDESIDKSEISLNTPHSLTNPLHITRILEAYRISDMPNFYGAIPQPKFDQIVLSSQGLKEEETWVWGQINKIFPVKIGLRILQKNLGNKQSIDLNEFLETAAKEAAEISSIVREYEKKNNKERNDKISAGLPLRSDEKSQSRYKFQFLAYVRKDGLLDGAMAILRFCNIEKKNGKIFIGLTEGGIKFSNAINPVLDNGDLDNALSIQEIECYLEHVKKNVLSEYVAVKWILKNIASGVNESGRLNRQLRADYGEIWNCSESVINTQRSGLTARVFELGLIEKEKNGIYVTYSLSKAGELFLSLNN